MKMEFGEYRMKKLSFRLISLLILILIKPLYAEPIKYTYSLDIPPGKHPYKSGGVVSGSFLYDPSAPPSRENQPAWSDEYGNYNQYEKAITDFVISIGSNKYTSSNVLINIVDAPSGTNKKDGFFMDSGSNWGGGKSFKGFKVGDWIFSGFNFYGGFPSSFYSDKELPEHIEIGQLESGMALHFDYKKNNKKKTHLVACCGELSVDFKEGNQGHESTIPDMQKFKGYYEKYKEASSVSQDESASHSEKQYQNFVASIYARKSYEIGLDIFGSDSKNISNLLDNYAHSSFKAGMYDNAIKASLLWEEFIKNKYGDDSIGLQLPYQLLFYSYNSAGKYSASKDYYNRIMNLIENKFDKKSVDHAMSVLDISVSFYNAGFGKYIKKDLKGAFEILSTDSNPSSHIAAFYLGKIAVQNDNYKGAIPYFEAAIKLDTTKNKVVAQASSGFLEYAPYFNDKNIIVKRALNSSQIENVLKNQSIGLIPITVGKPRYPRRAEMSGMTGYAIVQLTVMKDGGVKDIKLIEESPKKSGFGRSAIRAAADIKYAPMVVDGVALEVPGVLYKYSFAGFR